MYYQALGPLVVTDDNGVTTTLRQTMQRSLLCLLIARAGRIAGSEELIRGLWGEEPHARAKRTLHTHIWAIRRQLQSGCLLHSHPHGYALEATTNEVDILEFHALATCGKRMQRVADFAAAADLYERALALWREPPVADFPATVLGIAESRPLIEERDAVTESLIEVRLCLGEHRLVIPHLQSLTIVNPLRENLWAQLMTALYRSGRRADALKSYADAWKIFNREVGVEPGRPLQELHRNILADSLLEAGAPELGTERRG